MLFRSVCDKLQIHLRAIRYKNQLYDLTPNSGAYIINLDDSFSGKKGTHWVGAYLLVNKGRPELYYFDSFAGPAPIEVEAFAKQWGAHGVIRSNRQIQAINSNYCGQYVIDFLFFMTHEKKKTIR